MQTHVDKNLLRWCMLLAMVFCFSSLAAAGEKAGYLGWEKESPYNGYYSYKDRDTIKGNILEFKEVVPLPGMAPGTAFILEEGGDKILVHLCPVAFRAAKETGIRTGVKSKVSGCWTIIDGKDVFMAAKVKQGDNFEFKVRLTKDGTPFWTMSPEELAKETAAK